jgi:DNA helicase IV
MPSTTSVFSLPDRLSAKQNPALISDDEQQFARIERSLAESIADVSERLDAARLAPAGEFGAAVERDVEVRTLSARLRTLGRYGLDLCLGRMLPAESAGTQHPEPVYIGRLGLTDGDGARLLVDWRSPAAEPFFGATHANSMGLVSRRRYRWTSGRITDYWDEVFDPDLLGDNEGIEAAALDDQSAFIASLGASRSSRMRDVLGTIQADQDAIIRASSRGPLVVDGGPGTGKTVVALHRSAYLLYADQRISNHGSGLLFVGPSPAYMAYVADVLPSLGEDGAQLGTIRGLVEEGPAASIESDPEVARLKATGTLNAAIENAVRAHEIPPSEGVAVETPWMEVWLDAASWAEAFGAAEPGASHNEAREQVWEALLEIVIDQHDEDEVPLDALRTALARDDELRETFDRAWPLLDPVGLVAHLWSSPSYLRTCAPWLTTDEIYALQRSDPRAWTVSDLPLLDAARRRVGDPEAARNARRRTAVLAQQREQIDLVVDDLMSADDGEGVVQMFRGADKDVLRDTLLEHDAMPAATPDVLAGPFAHIVVDEAQELTDAEWGMLLARCPSRSFTIVGDRAQARHGFVESWQERLTRVGLAGADVASLTINYRTPEEVMDAAAPVILAALPDANVPTSIRSSGLPVLHGRAAELPTIVGTWLGEHAEGIACVIAAEALDEDRFGGSSRVRSLTPELAKGLEFDLVVLIDPDEFGEGIQGAVDRYVAMTRATQQLVVLTS